MRTESKLFQLLSRFFFTITETISQLLQLGVLRFSSISRLFLDGPLTMMIYMCVCERTNFYCFHYFYTRQKYITLNEIQLIALLVKEVSFSLKLLYTGFL